MTSAAAGPFAIGDRVFVPAFGTTGEVVDIGETHIIRAFGINVSDPEGEVRQITTYEVRLDHGVMRTVADRDGHLVHA